MSKPLSQQWYEAAASWTDLESAASLLEESKSAVLAQYMTQQGDIPVSRAEMLVKASPEWRGYLEKMNSARTAANKAKIKMEAIRLRFFEWQSKEATDRVEHRL